MKVVKNLSKLKSAFDQANEFSFKFKCFIAVQLLQYYSISRFVPMVEKVPDVTF